ncbi:hypothetical protein [Pseudomonas aeruginosa]|jgi:hypothetical protein|nr:hypothetical protein [Pseudomonas aeruginosa]
MTDLKETSAEQDGANADEERKAAVVPKVAADEGEDLIQIGPTDV